MQTTPFYKPKPRRFMQQQIFERINVTYVLAIFIK